MVVRGVYETRAAVARAGIEAVLELDRRTGTINRSRGLDEYWQWMPRGWDGRRLHEAEAPWKTLSESPPSPA